MVNKHRPWKSPIVNGFTSLPTPMTARVYVNLPEGSHYTHENMRKSRDSNESHVKN